MLVLPVIMNAAFLIDGSVAATGGSDMTRVQVIGHN